VREQPLLCRICHEPVSLKSDTVVDEDGKPVHENCYVKQVTGQDPASEVARILLTRGSAERRRAVPPASFPV
jgi:hypothetical protein